MKLPKDTKKDLRVSIEERSQPKIETQPTITPTSAPNIKTLKDGEMVMNKGTGYVRSRSNLNRMLMVDTANVTKVSDATTSASTTELASKLNEIITALKAIGAIE